jgi:hypothetical protein
LRSVIHLETPWGFCVALRHSYFARRRYVSLAHSPARQKAGLREENLLRNIDNPNEVILLFQAGEIEKAKEFSASADLREAMQDAGVVDKPDIYFLS